MWLAFWAELYAFLGKNALKGCLGVLAAILIAVPAYIYWATRIETPVRITYIEDVIVEATEETDDMLFLDEDNWNDTFDIRGPYSYYNLLSDEEQAEVVARAHATDAYYMAIIAQVEDLLDDYEKELKRPEKIYGKEKYTVALQSLLDALP